jgi:hypothetical protein
MMTGIYAASVALFQRVFVAVTGNSSDIAIVLATLVLASAFTPMRKGLEGVVDRHFKPASKADGTKGAAAPMAAQVAPASPVVDDAVVEVAPPAPPSEATMQSLLEQLRSMEARLASLEATPSRDQPGRSQPGRSQPRRSQPRTSRQKSPSAT